MESYRSRSTFWLFADNSIALGREKSLISSFKAYLFHTLLFHDKILLSDSLVVNTPNLRRLMQQDKALAEYFSQNCLEIARRANSGKVVNLVSVRDQLLEAGRAVNPGFDSEMYVFKDGGDLDTIERFASEFRYELADVQSQFTENLLSLERNTDFIHKAGEFSAQISQQIRRRYEEVGYLNQTFFQRGAPGGLPEIFQSDWDKIEEVVMDYQMAFYYLGIPNALQSDITFSPFHLKQRDIIRGASAGSGTPSVRVDLSRNGRSMYEGILSSMSLEQLKSLRSSPEFRCFRDSIQKLGNLSDLSDVHFEGTIKETHHALGEYHKRIDKDLKLLNFYKTSSLLLDKWELRGYMKSGAFVLKPISAALSSVPFRTTILTSVISLYYPHPAVLATAAYVASGGIPQIENAFNNLPQNVETFRSTISQDQKSDPFIPAETDINLGNLRRDTIYAGS